MAVAATGRDDDRGRAGGDLPQSGGAFFLEFRMRREILEGKHVACGEGDDRTPDRRRK